MAESGSLPFDDLIVLDLTRVRAGPTAVRQFGDWGADVIKIEAPENPDAPEAAGGARHGPDFQNIQRNKRSITLNLKADEGRAIFFKLVETADIVIENYRPDVKHRLGIDYEAVKAVNPRIIYGSISGFGQDGPYVSRPGVDQIAQGMGGLMSVTGEPGQGPMRVGTAIADLTTGLQMAKGIMIALYERERSGEGQWVHTSLLESQIMMLDFQAARWLIANEIAPQAGNNHPTAIPTGVYKSSDGYFNIAASGGVMFGRLCGVLGTPEIAENPDYAGAGQRSKNRDALHEAIEAVTVTRTSSDWIDDLNEAGVPCGPINNIEETFADEQVQHLGIALPMESPALGATHVVGQAVNLTRTPSPDHVTQPTPEIGQHTDEILAGLGYDADGIAALREQGAI
ncbi:MAG TPA: CaiB/BaiF CoA-transferase family protein [Dehalococcoidia bacterium]|nr:CaiB/BaiF CoA-transferase family protein [Dehalococcoidia bacterium]